jgi:hypothetical protein
MRSWNWIEDLPYDVGVNEIASSLEEWIGTDQALVYADSIPARDGRAIYIYFRGLSANEPANLAADATGLTGGTSTPTITVSNFIPASRNEFYEPIPSEVLFTYYEKPQVVVKVNDIPSICNSDCSIEFNDDKTITIQSVTASSTGLSMTILNPASLVLNQFNTRVSYAGNVCRNLAYSNLVITCDF